MIPDERVRTIRLLAIARKVSFGSQSEQGAKTRSILMTVLHTLDLRGEDVSTVERKRGCGRPNCVCAGDPKRRHPEKFVAVSFKGRTRTLHSFCVEGSTVGRVIFCSSGAGLCQSGVDSTNKLAK